MTATVTAAPGPLGVEITDVTHRFGDVNALDGATAVVRPGTITGLVGRNGAGKTTLAALIGSLRPVQRGTIRVGGADPWENPAVTTRICLARDKGGVYEDERIHKTLRMNGMLRPGWDHDYALELLDRFEVRVKAKPQQLSRGKRSALGAAIALATRADLTIVDEIYLGMDAVARRMFYDEILADYGRHPRTIILSSHLLDEVEDLLEDVIVLHRGRVAASGECDAVRQQYSGEGRLASLTDVLIAVSGSVPVGTPEGDLA